MTVIDTIADAHDGDKIALAVAFAPRQLALR
jgi:hypothetical protein